MAPPVGVNGILPVAVLQKNTHQPQVRGQKAAQPRLKLICRRLPPGLTKTEFETILGGEWSLGGGKTDLIMYRKGKISTDAAKPSKPARAYIHVTRTEYVKAFGDHIRATTIHDAAKSWQDPALIAPPSVEFAPYPKLPGGRRRNDNRQGTIDQDQEFKNFLESLTNPIAKSTAPESEVQKERVKTTPLIEALREKKANRDKPNTKSGRQARGDGKEGLDKRSSSKPGKENNLSAGDKSRRTSKADKAQAAREAVKILNKEVSTSKSAAALSTDKSTSSGPLTERRRGNIALAKSILQRDLGVGPAPTRRRGTKREVSSAASDTASQKKSLSTGIDEAKESSGVQSPSNRASQGQRKERPTRAERRAVKTEATEKPAKISADDTRVQTPLKTSASQILKKTQPAQPLNVPRGIAAPRAPPTEPAAARHKSTPVQSQPPLNKLEATSSASNTTATKSTQPPPIPAPTSKQAFLKHANPSQGITEPLIEEALKAFGAIEKVEIDKRKGFAYVDFAEPEGLQKAMAASPIKIAQGAVQVLERKEKPARNPRFLGPPTGPARGGRGGFPARGRGVRGGARGGASTTVSNNGSAPVSPSPVPAILTPCAGTEKAT